MKTVIITGSTRGIGLGMAEELLKRDCKVAVSSRSSTQVQATIKALSSKYGADRMYGLACDVTDSTGVQALWDGAYKAFGRIDIWINNAGITNRMKSLLEVAIAEVSPVVNTNITGLIYGSLIALRGMIAQGSGQIYNVYGHGSNDNKVAGLHIYGTTKRAVRYFTEALMQDAEGMPVQIGAISPGIVVTDFLIHDMRTMDADQLAMAKALYNCLADTVETVTPFLTERILKNNLNGADINWLPEEKVNERLNSDQYCSRDLFSMYGL